MPDLIAQRYIPPIDWAGVPAAHRGKLSAVCRTLAECQDITGWFGDPAFCPYLPILVMVPGTQPTLIPGFGYATAAELQDCAVTAWEMQSAKIAKQGAVLDYDSLRERHGLMRREEVDEAIRDALWRRAQAHKYSPVTDPMRQPSYPGSAGRTLHKVAEDQGWKSKEKEA